LLRGYLPRLAAAVRMAVSVIPLTPIAGVRGVGLVEGPRGSQYRRILTVIQQVEKIEAADLLCITVIR